MLRWSWIAVGVWVWCGLAAPAPAQEEPRAVVLITFDSVRPDHVGFFGWHRPTTPAIDAFLSASAVFERTYSPVTSSFGAHLSVLSSSSPVEHALVSLGPPRSPWKPSSAVSSVAEHLAGQRYRCAAFVSTRHIGTWSGLQAGFHTLDEPAESVREPSEIAALAERWLEVHAKEQRIFLWLHFKGGQEPNLPVMPYMTMFQNDEACSRAIDAIGTPPERFNQGGFSNQILIRMFFPELEGMVTPKGMRLQDVDRAAVERLYNRYDGDLRATDDAVQRVLAKLEQTGLAARTVVAMCSVTGQAFGEQTMLGRGEVTREVAQVFAAVRAPGLAPRRSSEVVSLVDLMPTALAHAGLGAKASFGRGLDVLATPRTHAFVMRPTREGERNPPGPIYALYSKRWKLVHRPERTDQLFDLESDPREAHDVLKEHPDEAAALRAIVQAELAKGAPSAK